MIFDVAARSLAGSSVLIPVDRLLGDAAGSRMPEVAPGKLNVELAKRVVEACPISALRIEEVEAARRLVLDYGDCIGCGHCIDAAQGAMRPASSLSVCGMSRTGLLRRWELGSGEEIPSGEPAVERAAGEIRALLGRALNIRQVDAGSCNGCEAEIGALTNPYYDLERLGIHFVASPKHADMLLVTGPVTHNMAVALKQTYEATPAPKLVVAVGACGCGGGIFAGSYAVAGPVSAIVPVDGYIPGCPPTPAMLLTGILQVLKLRR